MFQPDLFASAPACSEMTSETAELLDLPGILERLTSVCKRPRYSYMVLNLIAKASASTGSAGPYVQVGDKPVPVRDWLCDAMAPIARRDPRRLGLAGRVREDLRLRGIMPADPVEAEKLVQEQVGERIRRSGLTSVSRAVSELVKAGLLRRHYQGFRIDHQNRGAQRQAVYTLAEEARKALG